MKLNDKQKSFCDEYILTGNATQSYKTIYMCSNRVANVNGTKLLVNTSIKEYIENVNKSIHSEKIADMKEIKEFWTEVKRDKMQEMKDRLKASEFIAKTNAAFVDSTKLDIKDNRYIIELVDTVERLDDNE